MHTNRNHCSIILISIQTLPRNNSSNKATSIVYYGTLAFIIGLSFLFYAPCNYPFFNSDHAIHVLMAKDFQLPGDFYYWGQDRLGSLLPMVAFLVKKTLNIHYLYVCSFVQYLFLLIGFIFLSSQLNSRGLKVAICAVLFIPVNEYNALILIGHPYSSQLFAGCLFVYFFFRLKKYLLDQNQLGPKQVFVSAFFSFGTILFYLIGIWVSEFNAILILVPIIFVLRDEKTKKFILRNLKNFYFLIFEIFSILLMFSAFIIYKQIKATSVIDHQYNKAFLDKAEDIGKNVDFFISKLTTSLFFKDQAPFENFFNWFLIVLSGIIFFGVKTKRIKKSILNDTLLIICIVSSLMLFCSTWNLRSEFSPRYFTPIYIIFCFVILMFIDDNYYKQWTKMIVSLLFVFFGVRHCYGAVISKNISGPMKQYGEYGKLPKGTLMGDYGDVYKINSVAIDSLQSIPYEHQFVRNWDMRKTLLNANNFYFLNNEKALAGGFGEYVYQYGFLFKFSGIKHNCNGTEVLLYHKKDSLSRFIFRASNNQYVSVNNLNKTLSANQPDPSKAEVFGLVSIRSGTSIRSANGKFISANIGSDGVVTASAEKANAWEIFQIVPVSESKLRVRASNGKYISADQSAGNILSANRDEALDWETFEIIPQ